MSHTHRIQNFFFEKIHRWGRVCLHCGSFQANDSLFCSSCEMRLWKNHPEMTDFHETAVGISGKCLFAWYPDQDRMVSKLLLSLKGGKSRASFDHYVARFCSKIPISHRLKNSVLVPCPSVRNWDHALALAHSFSKILRLPISLCLAKDDAQGPQKTLGRSHRIRLEMTASEKIVNQHVIFIDDILTTGGTAAAAKRALGAKKGFEVWCLGRRQRSLGPETSIL